MEHNVKSVVVEEVNDDGFSYALITTTFENGDVTKVLKSFRQYQVETSIGRSLQPGETGLMTPAGPVVLKSGIPHPRLEIQVKDVPGPTSEYFMISSEGHLISKRSMKVVKENSLNGYPGHVTKIGGRQGKNYAMKLHLCVAKAFIPNPEDKPQVNHVDGNKENPSIRNLEWSTGLENMQHASSSGLIPKRIGEENSQSVLTPEMQAYIYENMTELSLREIGRRLGVSHWTISKFLSGGNY